MENRSWDDNIRLNPNAGIIKEILERLIVIENKLCSSVPPQPMTWQPIETAPEWSHIGILLWDKEDRHAYIGFKDDEYDRWWKRLDGYRINPTHWMPLPDSPDE